MEKTGKEKIIFIIAPVKGKNLKSFVGYNNKLFIETLEGYRGITPEIFDEISSLVKKDEIGKYTLSNEGILFVLPNEITKLHTQQYPLIIFNDETVIDIDEWWYSAFKDVLSNHSDENRFYTVDLKKWVNCDDLFTIADGGFLVKFKIDPQSDKYLYAIKSVHITF